MKNSTNMPYENIVVIIGRVLSINKVHERLGASFYEVNVRINRLTAGKYDDVIIYAPQWAMPTVGLAVGDTVRLVGEVRVYKNRNSLWQAKCMKVYTKKIAIVGPDAPHTNRVELIGDICRVWNKRKTPLTDRVLTDFSVLVYRTEGYSKGDRSDLIHCIAWGDEEYEKVNHSGEKVHIIGRIQQRAFEKEHENGTSTKEFTYEISCRVINIC